MGGGLSAKKTHQKNKNSLTGEKKRSAVFPSEIEQENVQQAVS
jgi:hypothetical protein